MLVMTPRRCPHRRSQGGFTLVQLLIGLVVSLVILSGVVYVFTKSSQTSLYQVRSTRFVQDMREGMDRMVRDVRRAGYMGVDYDVSSTSVALTNPFSSTSVGGISTLLRVSEKTGEPADSCILYAYNRNDDNPPLVGGTTTLGTEFSGPPVELYGFRLDAGDLDIYTGLNGGTTFNCNSGSWQAVTDPDLTEVIALSFTLNGECENLTEVSRSDCYAATPSSITPVTDDLIVEIRDVQITLTGRSVDDSSLTQTLTQKVSVGNNRIYEAP